MSEDTNANLGAEVGELFERLKRERDEIKLQMHLAKAEAREEWERLEEKWDRFHNKATIVGEAAAEVSKDIGEAANMLGEEINKGYQRIREAISTES